MELEFLRNEVAKLREQVGVRLLNYNDYYGLGR
jgi:hypothetical protein